MANIEREKKEYVIEEIEFKHYKQFNLSELKEKIKRLEDKANEEVEVVEGLRIEDLKVLLFADCDEELITLSLVGNRLETDEEWHMRIKDLKDSLERTVGNSEKILERVESNKLLIKEYEEALNTSPLKCEVCGKPWLYLVNREGEKTRRICHDCEESGR